MATKKQPIKASKSTFHEIKKSFNVSFIKFKPNNITKKPSQN